MKDILEDVGISIHDAENLFVTNSPKHLGTHTEEFFIQLHRMLTNAAGSETEVENALLNMRERVLVGEFVRR